MSGLLSGAAVVLLVLLQGAQSVRIQYQGFQVQLESMKKLRDLERQWVLSPRLQAQSLLPGPCYHPALPPDLQPICASREAASILKALILAPNIGLEEASQLWTTGTGWSSYIKDFTETIATDNCELCENVACTGCF